MKEIKIEKLQLKNFKCHEDLTVELGGNDAVLCGDNATGKTSVYDALTWLLFGKDSKGNGEKSIDIKPLRPDGAVKDHAAITEVTAVLRVDGEPVCLRRALRENRTERRGGETVCEGNVCEYAIDGIPLKKGEFDRRVAALIGEEEFRMLTGVSYFASLLDWKARRQILFDLAAVCTDRELMALNDRFLPLSEAMGSLSPEDFRKKLLAERKGLNLTRDSAPAKLSVLAEMERELSQNDFAAARSELKALLAEQKSLQNDLALLQNNAAVTAKEKEICQAKLKLQGLEANALRSDKAEIALKKEIDQNEGRLLRIHEELQTEKAAAENCAEQKEKISAEIFSGECCPTCGQRLPPEQLTSARERFAAQKRERLAQTEQREQCHLAAIAGLEAQSEHLREEIKRAEAELSAPVTESEKEALRQRAALLARIRTAEEEALQLRGDGLAEKTALRERLAKLDGEIAARNAVLGKEETLTSVTEKALALRKEIRRTEQRLAELEGCLYLLDEFVRYKTAFVENSINSRFAYASFRLFREQLNGGVEERCDVTYRGIPYNSLNNGARINIGIDIINTLSGHYGLRFPLFIDNAESVTKLIPTDTQVIRLIVSEKEPILRCRSGEELWQSPA